MGEDGLAAFHVLVEPDGGEAAPVPPACLPFLATTKLPLRRRGNSCHPNTPYRHERQKSRTLLAQANPINRLLEIVSPTPERR
jgi:hypothetical protein